MSALHALKRLIQRIREGPESPENAGNSQRTSDVLGGNEYYMSGRARLHGIQADAKGEPYLRLSYLRLDDLPHARASDQSVSLRPPPSSLQFKRFQMIAPPIAEVREQAFVERSLFWLDHHPNSGAESGYLSLTIWTPLFAAICEQIASCSDDLELEFHINTRGDRFGEWGFGNIEQLRRGGDKATARAIIFGCARFALRRLTFSAVQTAPPPENGYLVPGVIRATGEVFLPGHLTWDRSNGQEDRWIVKGPNCELRRIGEPRDDAEPSMRFRYEGYSFVLEFRGERIYVPGKGHCWSVTGIERREAPQSGATDIEYSLHEAALRSIRFTLPWLGAQRESERCKYVLGL